MELWTIGEFARAAALSPKALRRYDRAGVLRPALVDPQSGYRYYAPGQLGHARLVARLRRLGMPLARIAALGGRTPAEILQAVRGFWAESEAAHAVRRDLADLLVDELTGRDGGTVSAEYLNDRAGTREADSNTQGTPWVFRCAARCAGGRVRPENQDAAFAGAQLLAVADGFGPMGAVASWAAVTAFVRAAGEAALASGGFSDDPDRPADVVGEVRRLFDRAGAAVRETASAGFGDRTGDGEGAAGDLTAALAEGSARADTPVASRAGASLEAADTQEVHRDRSGDTDGTSGTTLTALFPLGDRLALAHLGDTCAYLLRGERFRRLSEEHTLVASLVAQGELTPEEAACHPQRTLLLRALTTDRTPTTAREPQLRLQALLPGDRFLLCSKGLPAAVPRARVRTVLEEYRQPSDAVGELLRLTHAADAPDNVACVVADALPVEAAAEAERGA